MPLEQQCMSVWKRPLNQTCPLVPKRPLAHPADCLFVFLDFLHVTLRVQVAACWLTRLCFKLNKNFYDREFKCPCDHFKVTVASLQIKPEMLQTSHSRAFIVSLHGRKEGVARPGGLLLITAPRTRDHTCVQSCCSCKEQPWGDGREPEVSPTPFTTQAAPVGSSVKCSFLGHGPLTQIPGWQPCSSLLQTLGPFILATPSATNLHPPPPLPNSGNAT